MSLLVSELPARSNFMGAVNAAALVGSRVRQRWCDMSRFRGHFRVCRLARCALIFIMAAVVLLEPVLAAERKTGAPRQHKIEAGGYPGKEDLLAIEKKILLLTNNERNARGLPAFQASVALTYLAGKQSENMCAARSLEHESAAFPIGWRKFTDRLKTGRLTEGAENIGYRTLREQPEKWATAVVKEWMKSPKHRKNILNPRWRYLGIGVRMCANKIAYATQEFSSNPGRIR